VSPAGSNYYRPNHNLLNLSKIDPSTKQTSWEWYHHFLSLWNDRLWSGEK